MRAPLLFLVRKEFRERYPTAFAFFGELFGLVASLTIYGFTSRAFSAQGAPFGAQGLAGAHNYFEYLVIGETALFLPLALFQGMARSFRQAVSNGTWEAILTQPIRPIQAIVLLGSALVPMELLRIAITLVCASLLFGLTFSGGAIAAIAAAFTLQLAALPAFLGLGIAAVGVLTRFGRGDRFLSYLGAGASILAGAYFPISVLPAVIQKFSTDFSPFTVLLESTRHAWAGDFSSLPLAFLILSAWSAASLLLGAVLFRAGIEHSRKSGLVALSVG